MKKLHFREWKISQYKRLLLEAVHIAPFWNFLFEVSANNTEVSLLLDICNFIGFSIGWTYKTDHAGIRLVLTLFGWDFAVELYDARHWDDSNNCWENL